MILPKIFPAFSVIGDQTLVRLMSGNSAFHAELYQTLSLENKRMLQQPGAADVRMDGVWQSASLPRTIE